MFAKMIALFVFLSVALRCEECLGQAGRPFYRPARLGPQQIIPEGPAWPASVSGYASRTRRPDRGQDNIRDDVNSRSQNFQSEERWESAPSKIELRDFENANWQPWGARF